MTVPCAFCNGTGVQPHSLKMACYGCHGKGKVEFEYAVITCFACKGIGRVSDLSALSCIQCRGVGMIEKAGEVHEKRVVKRLSGEKLSGGVAWFKTIVHKMKGVAKWIKDRFIREILWFKTIIHKIKRH